MLLNGCGTTSPQSTSQLRRKDRKEKSQGSARKKRKSKKSSTSKDEGLLIVGCVFWLFFRQSFKNITISESFNGIIKFKGKAFADGARPGKEHPI